MAKRSQRVVPSDDREPVQDPSLDSDDHGGGLADILTDEHGGDIEPPEGPKQIIRPSHLVDLMNAEGYKGDPHKFLKERGLPNPVKLFRVTGRGPINKVDTQLSDAEIDAVDESDAQRQFILLRNLPAKEVHRFRFSVVELEA